MIRVQSLSGISSKEVETILQPKSFKIDREILGLCEKMEKDFSSDSYEALKSYTLRFDKSFPKHWILKKEDLKQAYEKIKDSEVFCSFLKAYHNIWEFHVLQKPSDIKKTILDTEIGLKYQPFENVTLYVPGGKALYPSTVLMGTIPAKIAGVKNIHIATPYLQESLSVHPLIQGLAYYCGVSTILQIGGAHSIFASAHGILELDLTSSEFIYGPGNKYVASAKQYLSGIQKIGIDFFAGPSEVLIIADNTANPYYLAQDLMAQAEHDEDAISYLLTTSEDIAHDCVNQLVSILDTRKLEYEMLDVSSKEYLDRKKRWEITKVSIKKNGKIFVVDSIEDAINFSNKFAPEHLEIHTFDDDAIFSKIQSAGSVFLGSYSPVAMGDYFSGTNHILPTNRSAKVNSGVGVDTFLKRITFQKGSLNSIKNAAEPIRLMSEAEGLFDSHGYSVLSRLEDHH